MRIEVEVPAKAVGRPSLFFRFRLRFARLVEGLVARVREALQRRFARPPESAEGLMDVVTGLKADFEAHGIEVELDLFTDQILDSFYAERPEGTERPERQRDDPTRGTAYVTG